MFDHKGQNLIFVISQPRAGSTLVQRILGGHPKIHTVGEPWVMLHPLHALKSSGYRAEYDEVTAREALGYFLETLPGGEEEYIEALRHMAAHLYGSALETSGKQFFLDKTPRYYLVIPELRAVFPEARFIVLFRNPLAVLSSMIEQWTEPKSAMMTRRVVPDLVLAPKLLVDGIALLGNRGTVLRYEDLVANPVSEVRRICEFLELGFEPGLLQYGNSTIPRWRFGDPEAMYVHEHPVQTSAEKWMTACEDPQTWRLLRDYAELLGGDLLRSMGYSQEHLLSVLAKGRPAAMRLSLTYGLSGWMKGSGLEAEAGKAILRLRKRESGVAPTTTLRDPVRRIRILRSPRAHLADGQASRRGSTSGRSQVARSDEDRKASAMVFIHIPKAGGTILRSIIERQYPPDAMCVSNPPDFDVQGIADSLSKASRERIQCFFGHMRFGLHEHLVQPVTYVTMLRSPLDRVLSYYYYVWRERDHPLHEIVRSQRLTLSDCLYQGLSAELNDGQVRLLCGFVDAPTVPFGATSAAMLAAAKANLRSHFSGIGIAEEFDASLLLFGRLFGWSDLFYRKLNVTKGRPKANEIGRATRAAIEKHNGLDLELHEYANLLFCEMADRLNITRARVWTFRTGQYSIWTARALKQQTRRARYAIASSSVGSALRRLRELCGRPNSA
jgi:hypothetical protein